MPLYIYYNYIYIYIYIIASPRVNYLAPPQHLHKKCSGAAPVTQERDNEPLWRKNVSTPHNRPLWVQSWLCYPSTHCRTSTWNLHCRIALHCHPTTWKEPRQRINYSRAVITVIKQLGGNSKTTHMSAAHALCVLPTVRRTSKTVL